MYRFKFMSLSVLSFIAFEAAVFAMPRVLKEAKTTDEKLGSHSFQKDDDLELLSDFEDSDLKHKRAVPFDHLRSEEREGVDDAQACAGAGKEKLEDQGHEDSSSATRCVTPVHYADRIVFSKGSSHGYTYSYFDLMDFHAGDLIYGLHEVRSIAMNFVRDHETSCRSFGFITADEFNKLILFELNLEDSIEAKEKESQRLVTQGFIIKNDLVRFEEFTNRLLSRLNLNHSETFAKYRELSSLMSLDSPSDHEREFYLAGCEEAIYLSHDRGSKIHFILDGLSSESVYHESDPHYDSYTSHELRAIFKIWKLQEAFRAQPLLTAASAVSESRSILDTVKFYRGGVRVPAPWVDAPAEIMARWNAQVH